MKGSSKIWPVIILLVFVSLGTELMQWRNGNLKFNINNNGIRDFIGKINNWESGSGKIVTDERSLEPFDAIAATGAFDIEVSPGDEYSVQVKGDDNIIQYVSTKVENGELSIHLQNERYGSYSLNLYIITPELTHLSNAGAGSLRIYNFDSLTTLEVDNAGAGAVTLNGKVETLTIANAGVGAVEAFGLKAAKVRVKNAGMGNIQISASESIKGSSSGFGSIQYRGEPAIVDVDISGIGDISKDE